MGRRPCAEPARLWQGRLCVPSLQYAILMTMVLTIFIKYVLHSVDLQSENPWDNKAVYMLYTELFTGEHRPRGPLPR